MALLDLSQTSELQIYATAPHPGTQMFIYAPGSENLSPVFRDENLTEMQANPLNTDADGYFPRIFVIDGDHRIVLVSNQGKILVDIDPVNVRELLPLFADAAALIADRTLSYGGENNTTRVLEGDVLQVKDGGYTYRVAAPFDDAAHIATANDVRLSVSGRGQFTPEAFGAAGDGVFNDTAAWNAMLKAALQATAGGPVRVFARGDYRLDELETVSQFQAGTLLPVQQESVVFDFVGARLSHTGEGDGILCLEGSSATRYRYDLKGGIWIATPATRWLVRGRDVRGSTFLPEAYIGPSPCFGVLLQNWRTWSENNRFGGSRTLEGRRIGHILGFQGRKEAWAFEMNGVGQPTSAEDYLGEFSSDPVGTSFGQYYFNTGTEWVRRYNGTVWSDAIPAIGANVQVAGKSFARTKIHNLLAASTNDTTKDGLVVHVDGASLYDSQIDGVRGNVENDGGSLIYWNDNYALNTVIQNVGCEKANMPANARSYAFRAGPNFFTSTEPPELSNISWSGGEAEPVDPDAGVVFSGQYHDKFITTTAGAPAPVLTAGQLHGNTTVELVVKSNSNDVMGKVLVGRKNSSAVLRIEDGFARKATCGPWSKSSITASNPIEDMDGDRWIAPAFGSITAITLISDTPRTGGTCTAAVRHNTGLAGSGGVSIGLSAVLDDTNTSRSTTRQLPGVDGFSPGDEIYAVVTSNSSWAPGTANVRAIIEVQLDGDVVWRDDNGDLTATTATNETLRVMTRVWKA